MARRLRDEWGSITEVERGKRYRIRYWADTPDGYKRCSVTVRGTRRDAEKMRAQLMVEHGDDAPCPTLGQVWEDYVLPSFDSRLETGDMSPRTYAGYVRSWNADVAPTWKDRPCDEVRPLHVQQWLSALGYTQAKRGLQMLSTTLDIAVRYEFTDRNAAREKYMMPSKSTISRRDSGIWNLEELGMVWQAVIQGAQWMEPAFIIAAFGGARVSESVGVLSGEVELVDSGSVDIALVPIVRQVTKGAGISDRLKTETSRRTTVIAGRAAIRLYEMASSNHPGIPLTNDGRGQWVSRDRFNRAWNKDVLPLLPEGQRHPFQNLRNSWQTNCRWSLDMPPWIVEPLMGHVGEGITGKHYDRPQAEMFVSAVSDAYRKHRYDAGWDFVPLGQIGTQDDLT